MAAFFQFIGYAILVILYVILMVVSLALGLVGGAFVSVFMSFKHYILAFHEEVGG